MDVKGNAWKREWIIIRRIFLIQIIEDLATLNVINTFTALQWHFFEK